MLLEQLIKALVATIVIELLATLVFILLARLWGKTFKFSLLLSVVLANIITNPAVNVVVQLLIPDSFFEKPAFYGSTVLFLELGVWFLESLIFFYWGKVKPFWISLFLSLFINLSSYLSGGLLTYLGYWQW